MTLQKLLVFTLLSFLICSTTYSSTITNQDKNPDNLSSNFNVTDYGAVGDGITLNTTAFQSAIDACANSGGGTVVIPSGIYLSGTIVLKNNICLHFEHNATLLGSTRHEDFPLQPLPKYRSHKDKAGGFYALIYAEGATNIALTGTGTINGQGKNQIPRANPKAGDIDGRPRSILFISCKFVRVEGLRINASGVWNQHYLNCEDVVVDKISVYNHVNRNNDAIDIDGCRRFTLSNSIFDTDDDGITLKSTGAAPCENIAITNCIVSSFCNAIKAGTESTGGFRNITISNCVIKPSISKEVPVFNTPRIGITGISLEIVDGGTMEGVTISNITIEGTQCPLYIRLGNRARKHTEGVSEPGLGTMKNISISNIVAYKTGNFSSSITSFPGSYIENISLNNIQFFNEGGLQKGDYIETIDGVKEDEKGYPQPTAWENLPSSVLFIRHAKNVIINGLMAGSNNEDPRIPIIAHDVEGLSIKNSLIVQGNTANTFFMGKDISIFEVEKPLGWKGQVTNIE